MINPGSGQAAGSRSASLPPVSRYPLSKFRQEAAVFFKLWLFMFFSYLMIVLAYDIAVHHWVDLRHDSIARLVYLPIGQALAFQLLTYPRRNRSKPSSAESG